MDQNQGNNNPPNFDANASSQANPLGASPQDPLAAGTAQPVANPPVDPVGGTAAFSPVTPSVSTGLPVPPLVPQGELQDAGSLPASPVMSVGAAEVVPSGGSLGGSGADGNTAPPSVPSWPQGFPSAASTEPASQPGPPRPDVLQPPAEVSNPVAPANPEEVGPAAFTQASLSGMGATAQDVAPSGVPPWVSGSSGLSSEGNSGVGMPSEPGSAGLPGVAEPVPTFTPTPLPADAAPNEPSPASQPSAWSSSALPLPGSAQETTGQQPDAEMGGQIPGESVPTDLSHLVGNSNGVSGNGGALSQQTPVEVPAAPAAEGQESPAPEGLNSSAPAPGANQAGLPASGHGFPKQILLIGVVVLLLVVAASAYFILGVGQTPPPQISVPAEQQPLSNPPRSLLPTPTTPVVETPPSASGGASLGNLSGATPTPATSSGTSALDLLRQRQSAGQQ